MASILGPGSTSGVCAKHLPLVLLLPCASFSSAVSSNSGAPPVASPSAPEQPGIDPTSSNDDLHWWDGLGGQEKVNGFVYAFTLYDSSLVAGGLFTQAGGVPARDVARWDGKSWHALGDGMRRECPGAACVPRVYALTVYNGDLIAAGYFHVAGGQSAPHIARWNGSVWQALGAMDNAVVARGQPR